MSFQPLPHFSSLQAYVPGKQPDGTGWVKLNTNENPYPPSPNVKEIADSALDYLRLYPDPSCKELRSVIAELHSIDKDSIVIGNGSDDILNILFRLYTGQGEEAIMMDPSYSHYPVLADIQNSKIRQIPFNEDYSFDLKTIKRSQANILFLTSPNAPLSIGFTNDQILELADSFSGLLVVDEAYADFAKENALKILFKRSNLFITRTLSKSYSLAGLRVGYGIGQKSVIEMINKVRDPYNVSLLSQRLAKAAIQDREYFEEKTQTIIETRERYKKYFQAKGWFVFESQTNFLFMQPKNQRGEIGMDVAESLFQFLEKHKILVRFFGKHELTKSYLRVTIGTNDEMNRFKEVTDQWKM